MSRKSQTGGNTEPLPFVRKWGIDAENDRGNNNVIYSDFPPKIESDVSFYGEINEITSIDSTENRQRRRSRSGSSSRRKRSRSRGRKSRSRSVERKKRRKHSRSRERRRSRSSSYDRRKHESKETESRTEKNPMNAVAEAAARAAAIIRMKQQATEKLKTQGAVIEQLLAKPEATVKLETNDETAEQRRERKKKSRWSTAKSFVPGMPTILPSDIDENQRQSYLLTMEIEEATRKLRQGDYLPPPDVERSVSPEPIYDANGKRLNTREIRKRQELEQKRHEKIQTLLKINPQYKPPADYRPPNIRLHDKVWIPQEEHPEVNFVGLLIGPRGNTLKALEQETGAKIIIRGKGSVKEGKMGRREGPLPGENEPLHAYITGTDQATIKRGCEKIREIINAALMIPDGQNELRKLQLRELAVLNGTLRPEDLLGGTRCSNCGSDQHKTWECPDAPNVTANVVCTACGCSGHIAKDCKNPRPGYQFDGAGMDDEYTALMAELGQKTESTAVTSTSAVSTTTLTTFPVIRPPVQPLRFRMPGGNPIMRVNLAKPTTTTIRPPTETITSYWGNEAPPPFFGSVAPTSSSYATANQVSHSSWPPQMQQQWPNVYQQPRPLPVPPPPQGSLSIFPPPPPPPPPPPKLNNSNSSGNNLSAYLAPPPPPS